MFGSAAFAQEANVVALKSDPSQAEWVKLCGDDPQTKKKVCFTQRNFATETNQPVMAVAVYDPEGRDRFVRFIMPLGFMIEPGMRARIDEGKPINGKYQICMPNGCFAEIPVTDATLKAMKAGNLMRIEVQNQLRQDVAFTLPLDGFTKAFDGEAIDPKVLAEQNQKLEQELANRVEQQRKLLEQQAADGAAPTPQQ